VNPASVGVVAIFAAWLLCSILVYIPRLRRPIRNYDIFGLVPEWRFFAPNPGRTDFHLLYRDKYRDGTLSNWTEVAAIGNRRVWNMLYNPMRRRNKALFDCMQEFSRHVNERDPVLELSIPYLTLLNYVSCLFRNPLPEQVQFLLMYSAGEQADKDPEPLYVSGFHRL
jgi:hypothetical protein